MIVLTLLLAVVPFLNGLIGGGVGGYLAGSSRRALAAAVLPALFVAIVLGLFSRLTGVVWWEWFAGLTAVSLAALSAIGTLLGAALGGYLAANRREEQLGTPPVSPDHPDVYQEQAPRWIPRPPGKRPR